LVIDGRPGDRHRCEFHIGLGTGQEPLDGFANPSTSLIFFSTHGIHGSGSTA